MPGILDRSRFWWRAVRQGTASLNTSAGWLSLVVLALGVAAGITVPLVLHVSHWVTAVIILGAALVVVAEGSYLEWKATDELRRKAESALGGAQAEHEIQPPPKTGLEIVIEDEKQTPFPGAAIVLEIEFRVTNHDPVPHQLRRSMRGLNRTSFPPPDNPDLVAARSEEHAIQERRRRNGDELPPRVQPGETVRGIYVTTFPWDPTGTFPDYTLIIKDERQAYTARPHGAAEDPLAAWPIT